MDSMIIPYHSIPFHTYSMVKTPILLQFIHYSYGIHGVHPFHMESIWKPSGSGKYRSSCLALLPCIWSWVTWRVLAIEPASMVDASGVALVGCMGPVMVVCPFRGRWSLVAWLWYFVGSLLVFLDGWGHVTQWRSGGGLSLGGVSRLWEMSLAWWL